jgi:hypothetical protein
VDNPPKRTRAPDPLSVRFELELAEDVDIVDGIAEDEVGEGVGVRGEVVVGGEEVGSDCVADEDLLALIWLDSAELVEADLVVLLLPVALVGTGTGTGTETRPLDEDVTLDDGMGCMENCGSALIIVSCTPEQMR